ncbi:NADH dehydrogenase [ubiquinone] 1 alpha subcomplex subunit 6 [Portunus trituberculatus]|uniref:NADH dehydrogenase [ubiquinone] 1 alpha subcomplex subunit 6 n=1 Tax=Portunus trituberculatus TaxID=210409 RepID=A0A5B7IS41_PORTR|nr:NADH dehydrogenase [ubiquinone] 1 alpha subcomplex subunit 6 [Portunus trituberculatus]
MASKLARAGVRQVKPILSVDHGEARQRVLNLYKAWYRQLPYIGQEGGERQCLVT